MRRTAIKPRHMYALAQEYMATRPRRKNLRGGRPKRYDDAMILTIAMIQNLNGYSYREALEFCEEYFADLPVLSTHHYRLRTFTPEDAQGFVAFVGKKVSKSSS